MWEERRFPPCSPVAEKKRAIMTRLIYRVWKGILGIRDWTEIQYRVQENAKWFNGIRDLTTTREAEQYLHFHTLCLQQRTFFLSSTSWGVTGAPGTGSCFTCTASPDSFGVESSCDDTGDFCVLQKERIGLVNYSHKRFKVVFCRHNKKQQKQSNGQILNLRFFFLVGLKYRSHSFYHRSGKIYGKEPRYNKTSL